MRTPFICGNWKMYKTIGEAIAFVQALCPKIKDLRGVEIGLGVQFVALKSLADACRGTPIWVGAQDCFWKESGAYTGEVSPSMIRDGGGSFVIIGHSERRQYFHETNETVNLKTKAALAAGLQTIVCVGETLEEREKRLTEDVVRSQVTEGLVNLTPSEMERVVIAYEPVWAIGTGKTATPTQAQEVHALIRSLLATLFGDAIAQATRIQYGGSVKPNNIQDLMAQPDIDGALVGGASLEVDSFAQILAFKG